MMQGRLKRETNPVPGEKPGFTPQYKDSDGSFIEVSPETPYPTVDKDVKEELALIKQQQAEILERLNGTFDTQVTGSNLEEQLTEADAVSGVLTFAENLKEVEIYNTDPTNTGTFNVNNINIKIPADSVFSATVGGTPSNQVTVSGATTYIIGRYA